MRIPFFGVLKREGITAKRVGPRAPNLNEYSERWIQTLRRECLDHFVVFGQDHLRHLINEFVTYYHRWRPHQGLGNRPLTGGALAGLILRFAHL